MEPVDFDESDRTLLKPKGMTDEECSDLPIYADNGVCISCWRPTIRERLSMLFFGKIWLRVTSGYTQPPVSLEVRKTIFVKAKSK